MYTLYMYVQNSISSTNHRGQCEELRSVLSKRHQDEVCRERADQLGKKQEDTHRQQQGEQRANSVGNTLANLLIFVFD